MLIAGVVVVEAVVVEVLVMPKLLRWPRRLSVVVVVFPELPFCAHDAADLNIAPRPVNRRPGKLINRAARKWEVVVTRKISSEG